MERDNVEELKSKVSFLEKVIDYMPFGVFVLDSQGKTLIVNRAQERAGRVSREEVVGRFFHDLMPGLLAKTELGFHYWSLVHEKKAFEYIFHDILPELKISGLGLGAPLPGDEGLLLVHHVSGKIREDRHALGILANNLAASRTFLQNLVDSSPSAIITASTDDWIRSANSTAGRIFGYTTDELLWKQVGLLFVNKPDLENLMSTTRVDSGIEVLCRRKEGEVFQARLQIGALRKQEGEVQERLVVITDISKEKDLEQRLAVSEKLAIYSELIAGIFHQINNPLVGVVNFSSILLDRMGEGDPSRPMVETMNQAARQCQSLISVMMKGFREPQSTFVTVRLPCLLEHAVQECLRENADLCAGISVATHLPGHLPEIRGDALQLGEVFRNLINNALAAMADGGHLGITAEVDQASGEVCVRFADTGCGIPQENLSRIFTPFFSTKKKTGGGLGLSFAYRVVNNHSGRIDVASTKGKGSVFTVALPFIAPAP